MIEFCASLLARMPLDYVEETVRERIRNRTKHELEIKGVNDFRNCMNQNCALSILSLSRSRRKSQRYRIAEDV